MPTVRKPRLTKAQREKRSAYQRQRRAKVKSQIIEASSGNVFADLGLENADELLAKAEIARQAGSLNLDDIVFVPDSVIPKRVRWDGYGRIKPWIARYVYDTYGCILRHCLIRHDMVKGGHWIKGPQKKVK